MSKVLLLLVTLVILHLADSYILLTANMEDVQSVVKQLSSSPVIEQVKKIWRRAANQFNAELNKSQKRQRYKSGMDSDNDQLNSKELFRRRNMDALISLGKNASEYINSVKDVINKVLA
ncbi:unnamed protein product, partial [Iphiclides podalirius]